MGSDKLVRNLNRLLFVFWGSMMAFVLILNVLKSHFDYIYTYYHPIDTLLPHPVLMLLGWLGLLILFLIFSKIWNDNTSGISLGTFKRYPFLIVTFSLFCLQVFFIYNYFFETDWDVQILLDTARQIAYGGDRNMFSWYYSMCPNNLLLTQIFSVILFIANPLHLGCQDLFAIIFVQCVWCTVASIMLYQLCIKLWHSQAIAVFSYVTYWLLVGLSPWVSITYSDIWALPFPILLLWLCFCIDWRGKVKLKWLIMAFVAWFGFKIKPQVCFVFVAILLVEGISCWKKDHRIREIKALIANYIVPLSIGLLLGIGTTSLAVKSIHISVVKSQAMGAPHYLMMGLNKNHIGSYNDPDVVFSYNFPSKSERAKANLKETQRRVREMGVGGFAKLMCEKTLVNYYDGTFCWGWEGAMFYKIVFPLKNSHLSPFLRSVFYNRDYRGEYFSQWFSFVTALWLGVLLLAFFSVFAKWDKSLKMIAITLLLLTLYECLFEARSRYFFAFVPLYLLMASQGANVLALWLKRGMKKLQ